MAELRRTSELRQVELTDAALSIVATKGIAALTTRSLAAEVGLSTGAIFRHFASIDALLDAVVERVEAVLEATFPSAELPPVERLAHFIEARSSAVGNQLGILRLVLSEQFLLALPRRGSARLAACVEKTRVFVIECLREGQAEGSLRADLPAETLAPIVMGTVQMLALSPSRARQREADARAVMGSLLAILRSPAAVSRSKKGHLMKRLILPTLTVAALALGGCATSSVAHHPAAAGPASLSFALPETATTGEPRETRVLVDEPALKLASIVLRNGTVLPTHHAAVPVTIVALHGSGTVVAGAERLRLDATHAVFLAAGVPHAVEPAPGTELVLLVHHLGQGEEGHP